MEEVDICCKKVDRNMGAQVCRRRFATAPTLFSVPNEHHLAGIIRYYVRARENRGVRGQGNEWQTIASIGSYRGSDDTPVRPVHGASIPTTVSNLRTNLSCLHSIAGRTSMLPSACVQPYECSPSRFHFHCLPCQTRNHTPASRSLCGHRCFRRIQFGLLRDFPCWECDCNRNSHSHQQCVQQTIIPYILATRLD